MVISKSTDNQGEIMLVVHRVGESIQHVGEAVFALYTSAICSPCRYYRLSCVGEGRGDSECVGASKKEITIEQWVRRECMVHLGLRP